MSYSITLRKTGPRKHPETIRPIGRAEKDYVYGEGVVKAQAVNLLTAESFVVPYSVFCISDLARLLAFHRPPAFSHTPSLVTVAVTFAAI